MEHRIIEGKVMRVVQLEAADVAKHVMQERPLSPQEQRAYLATLEQEQGR